MASLNVYLPDDLKKRMDAAGDLGWSRIAQAAFAEMIARHRIREDQDMSAVAERLRASKRSWEEEIKREYFELGADWARETAKYHEIKAVVNAEDAGEIMYGFFGGAKAYVEYGEINAERELEAFFGFTSRDPEPIELHAFADGVKSVWNEVAAEVEK